MEKLLEIDQLTKVFSFGSILSKIKLTAVDNISFDIKPAEIFALAGESGCGKSTTARMIMGFESPTSGQIIHSGTEVAKNEKVWFTQGIQAIFQDPFGTFNPLRTVDRYFFETVKNYKLAKNKTDAIKLIDAKLKAVGLSYEEFAGKYPSEFSGGQLQRISVARSLLTDPKLLIADEPVSMVDASLRMSIVNLFKELKENFGVSVLYITHDLATAYYVSDRIAIMFRGDIVEMGPVEQVLMEPKHPYTQLLRESIPEADPEKRWNYKIDLSELEYEEYMRKGCKFAGRCPQVMEICKAEMPQDTQVGKAFVKCHLYSESQKSQNEVI
ncbi:MAG TPA: peptide ABC transporter ATP-binding protein [Chloroflexi bacterium]|nr:peptide ABC transporter ATP-binding protein [Chloroflexota bacterium]HBY08497.1 peptide ABC transporter ATP-binding protein [Chloroflexota bacterium]